MAVPPVATVIALSILLAGFAYYVFQARKYRNAEPTRFSFYLGGRRIGPNLTKHTNWGVGFSFSNGTWFCLFLAYHYGLTVFLIQLVWSASIAALALSVPAILRATAQGQTVHGAIGDYFGANARRIASLATAIGYFLNCGFEVYFSSEVFALTLGQQVLAPVIALALAIVAGAYCMIGGYEANAQTDQKQNVIGMIACIVLVAMFVVQSLTSPSAAGSKSAFVCEAPPWDFTLGLVVFLALFNFFDMANWQMIAANVELSPETQKELRGAFVKSGLYQMVFPTTVGAVVGLLLRRYSLKDGELFPYAFATAVDGLPASVVGVVLGVLFLGMLSLTLSSADSYLLAAAHTIDCDLARTQEYDRASAATTAEERDAIERPLIAQSKRLLIPLSIAMVGSFAVLYRFLPQAVFQLQFIMYGSALALAPSLIYRLRRPSGSGLAGWSVASIAMGIIAGVASYLFVLLPNGRDLSSLAPVFSLGLASLVFGVGALVHKQEVATDASLAR